MVLFINMWRAAGYDDENGNMWLVLEGTLPMISYRAVNRWGGVN